MIKVGIIGATGYAGGELVRILTGHREAEIKWYGSRSYIDKKYADVYQNMFQIIDPEQAALAALLHDAAKELPKDEMRAIMQAYPEYAQGGEARPTPVWHGICAAILARTEWGVTDEAVLSAIACHTAGKAGMTQLDKILYLADMTSAERDWPGVEKLRKLEMKDLDAAMLAALKQTNGFVLSEGKPLDPESKAAYEDILAHSGQNEG